MELYEKKEHEDGSITFEKWAESVDSRVTRILVDYQHLRRGTGLTSEEALKLMEMSRQRY